MDKEWQGQAECTECQNDSFRLFFDIENGKVVRIIAECADCENAAEIKVGKQVSDA